MLGWEQGHGEQREKDEQVDTELNLQAGQEDRQLDIQLFRKPEWAATANSCWLIFSPSKIPAAAAARQFFKDMVKGFCKSLYTINQYGENLECSSQQLRIPWAFPNWCFFGSLPVAVISGQRGQITCTTHSLNSGKAAVWPKSAMSQCWLKWQNSPYLPVRLRPGIHD